MLTGFQHRREHREGDSRSPGDRALAADPEFWDGYAGRNRGGREDLRRRNSAEQLLRTEDARYEAGLRGRRKRNRRVGLGQWRTSSLVLALPIVAALGTVSCANHGAPS